MNHSFDVNLAIEYGVNAAIIFQSIAWWCEHSRANNTHFHDGHFWTYNSNRAFQKLFPYMSGKQITTAIDKLITAGVIIKGNYNQSPYDRTLWYAVTELGESKFRKGEMEECEMSNQNSENVEPIPVISTVISNGINNNDDDNVRVRVREDDTPEEAPNAFGDADYRPNTGTIQQYAINSLKYMGVRAMQELGTFLDDLPEPVVRHGLDNALDADKRTWSYVRAILNSYVEAGVKTVQEAVDVDRRHNQRYGQPERTRPAQNKQPQNADNRLLNMPFTT